MSKTTKSILTSLLLGSALASPALAGAPQRHSILERFLGQHLLFMKQDQHLANANRADRHLRANAPGSGLIVYDEQDAAGDTSGGEINATGSVEGAFQGGDGHTHGFLRAPGGSFTEINVGRNPTEPFWLNDKGAMAGIYLDNGVIEGFIRTPTGKFEKFDGAGGGSGGTFAFHINNKGIATGDYVDSNGVWHAYLRAKDGTLTQFDEPHAALGADQGTFAGATNDRGDTTGPYVDASYLNHGYIRHRDGTYTEFDVAGAVDTIPFTINAKGWVVGPFDDDNGAMHGFIRKPNGEIIVVDAPGAGTGAGQGTSVAEINTDRIATGNYIDANDVSHGFVFRVKGRTIAEFDAPGAGSGPGQGTTPVSIDGDGVISGSMVDENNNSHGMIGTPP